MSLTVSDGSGHQRPTERERFALRYFLPGERMAPSVAAGDPAIMVVAQVRHLAALARSPTRRCPTTDWAR